MKAQTTLLARAFTAFRAVNPRATALALEAMRDRGESNLSLWAHALKRTRLAPDEVTACLAAAQFSGSEPEEWTDLTPTQQRHAKRAVSIAVDALPRHPETATRVLERLIRRHGHWPALQATLAHGPDWRTRYMSPNRDKNLRSTGGCC